MLSRSGETCMPSTSTSSPTLPITVTSAGSVACASPRRNRAPPTPPESATTFMPGPYPREPGPDRYVHERERGPRSAALEGARPHLHGRVHDRARHRDRERRAPVARLRPALLGGQPAVG